MRLRRDGDRRHGTAEQFTVVYADLRGHERKT
jgi:hypothetical protein